MEVASGLAGGTLMTVAGQTMLAVVGQSMTDAPSVIIIGAGASGIAMAHQLKHDLGFGDFTIYEKSDRAGGFHDSHEDPEQTAVSAEESSVLVDNDPTRCTYPSSLYCFSFHQNYAWKHQYSSQAEVLDYLQDTITKFDLAQHIHLSVEVVGARWIDDKNCWQVTLKDIESGEEYNRYCTVLISAAGSSQSPDDFSKSPRDTEEQLSSTNIAVDRYLPLARRLKRIAAYVAWEKSHTLPSLVVNSEHAMIDIVGSRDGRKLAQYWKETRQPQAYWGCLVASFPNFGLINGPYAFPSRNSPLLAVESCVAYLSRNLVSPILDNRATRVEVRQAVEDRWASTIRHDASKEMRSNISTPTPVWPHSALSFYVQGLLYGSRGLVYKNGQTAWWMNMLVRWAKSVRFRTWLMLLLGIALLRVKAVKSRVDRARADVEKYVPYEKQAFELAGKFKDSVLK